MPPFFDHIIVINYNNMRVTFVTGITCNKKQDTGSIRGILFFLFLLCQINIFQFNDVCFVTNFVANV